MGTLSIKKGLNRVALKVSSKGYYKEAGFNSGVTASAGGGGA